MATEPAPPAAVRSALTWSLVVPVKVLAAAKSRLTGLAGPRRPELALAMAADTVAAALAAEPVADVLVVTDDPEVSKLASGLGAVVLPDGPDAGLNEALAYGASFSRAAWPDRGCGGLAGDVPAARPEELAAALATAAVLGTAFVPDADGTGTVLYAVGPGRPFQPRFGPSSRDRHLAAGAAEIGGTGSLRGLRRDVDTAANLRAAAAIGLGPHTRALLAADPWLLD